MSVLQRRRRHQLVLDKALLEVYDMAAAALKLTKPSWEKARVAHGGKHAAHVEKTLRAISRANTPQGRLNAALDVGAHNLIDMKYDGSTPEDVFDALKHVVDNAESLRDAIKNGVKL